MSEPTRHAELRREAAAFHAAHPEVWELFVTFTFQKIHEGHAHYGAKAIMERVRWETEAGGDKPALKINNNLVSFYARRFAHHYPSFGDFFRQRKQKSQERPARQRPEPSRFELQS